jgi:hypothetical protein
MVRPERPVTGDGPLPAIARALRLVRAQAGNPGYRELGSRTQYSKTRLSDAASGAECPSWEITKAFADACDPTGNAALRLRSLWEKASQAERNRRRASSRRRRAASASPVTDRGARSGLTAGAPRPEPDGTAIRFVYQLRALRAWAGNPGHKEIGRRAGRPLASSTMYDALNPGRTNLPPLETVQAIVHACLPDPAAAAAWITAWCTVKLREFERANPLPADEPRPALRVITSR